MRRRTLLLILAVLGTCLLMAKAAPMRLLQTCLAQAMQIITRDHLSLPYALPPTPEQWQLMSATDRLANVRLRLLPKLHAELAMAERKLGQPAFIRIFKESRELELWLQGDDNQWKLFRTYPIACFSGNLGPKTKEGDLQAPEGFYSVTPKLLNPASRYHLAFNIGYPNAYDLAHQRTGNLIMIHGDMVSIGCFAMTDPLIEEIYLIVEAALKANATVPVHSFPFRMHAHRMKSASFGPENVNLDFWRELEPAFHQFESTHTVPQVTVDKGLYRVH